MEIKILANTLEPGAPMPHLKIAELVSRYLAAEKTDSPEKTKNVIAEEFGKLFGKSWGWTYSYMAYLELPQKVKEILLNERGELRVPFYVVTDLARDPTPEIALEWVASGLCRNDNDLKILIKRLTAARRQIKGTRWEPPKPSSSSSATETKLIEQAPDRIHVASPVPVPAPSVAPIPVKKDEPEKFLPVTASVSVESRATRETSSVWGEYKAEEVPAPTSTDRKKWESRVIKGTRY